MKNTLHGTVSVLLATIIAILACGISFRTADADYCLKPSDDTQYQQLINQGYIPINFNGTILLCTQPVQTSSPTQPPAQPIAQPANTCPPGQYPAPATDAIFGITQGTCVSTQLQQQLQGGCNFNPYPILEQYKSWLFAEKSG